MTQVMMDINPMRFRAASGNPDLPNLWRPQWPPPAPPVPKVPVQPADDEAGSVAQAGARANSVNERTWGSAVVISPSMRITGG